MDAIDMSGPWSEPQERSPILSAHAYIVWAIVCAVRQRPANDTVLRAAARKALNESTWAATETRRSMKYKLRFISQGVLELCRIHGHLDAWAKEGGPIAVRHEHVVQRKELKEQLLSTSCLADVHETLEQAQGCVVTLEEDGRLRCAQGSGWNRYTLAGVGAWDRRDQRWQVHPRVPVSQGQ